MEPHGISTGSTIGQLPTWGLSKLVKFNECTDYPGIVDIVAVPFSCFLGGKISEKLSSALPFWGSGALLTSLFFKPFKSFSLKINVTIDSIS